MVRSRLAEQVEHIRHWKVIEGDYSAAPAIEATWFIDPPYQKMGKYYHHSAKKLDFDLLGQWCGERQGQVIVCEGAGADWLPFKPFCTTRSSFGKQKANSEKFGYSVEVIWTNEPEPPALF